MPSPEIRTLFANGNPDEVWAKAENIVRHINPAHDFYLAHMAFDDVVSLFRGKFPGYCEMKTLYHDLSHTMDVFMCAVRLMHGVHISGTPLADDEITWIMMSALLHDIGYAQQDWEDTGTGAQFTQDHVRRGIAFMQRYLAERHFPPGFAEHLEPIMLSTDPAVVFSGIDFPSPRTRLLAQIVGTADMIGQMADRAYLEKLLFLYLEFREAHFGNYHNVHELLSQTKHFYEVTREKKLEQAYEGIYNKLTFHFKDWFGDERNYYLESIEKNIAYLSKVMSLNEEKHLSMLKRGGILKKAKALAEPPGLE